MAGSHELQIVKARGINMTKQVVVVGGGIVGLTAAYFAALTGDKVILVEASSNVGGLLKSSQSEFGFF
jgi:glycine/D-amino acid oxidase-like deaminating enzyme